jgi:uncharacterized protein involved in exopolysaccharide biosynthesis
MPDSSRRAVAVFRWLLRFYPAAFRCEYEEKLILLFQDQLRDARARKTTGAMVRFWLRMIVDTGRSAGREHWSELRRAWGLSSPLALLIHVLPTPGRRVGAAFFGALLVSLGVWWVTPPTYVSTARLQLPTNDGSFDPYELQTRVEQVSEPQTLEGVARSFRPETKEGEIVAKNSGMTLPRNTKYGSGTLEEEVRRMQRHLAVREFRNTPILEVQFSASDPTEAAAMANRVAMAYQVRIREAGGPLIDIVDPAIPGLRPVAPRLGQALVFAVLFGFGGGGLLEVLLAAGRRSAESIRTA